MGFRVYRETNCNVARMFSHGELIASNGWEFEKYSWKRERIAVSLAPATTTRRVVAVYGIDDGNVRSFSISPSVTRLLCSIRGPARSGTMWRLARTASNRRVSTLVIRPRWRPRSQPTSFFPRCIVTPFTGPFNFRTKTRKILFLYRANRTSPKISSGGSPYFLCAVSGLCLFPRSFRPRSPRFFFLSRRPVLFVKGPSQKGISSFFHLPPRGRVFDRKKIDHDLDLESER